MSKKVKNLIESELKSRFQNVSECLIVSIRGISGTDNNELRGDLRKNQIYINVVKNSLAGRAFSDLGMDPVSELLTGPCAVAYGADNIVDLAKTFAQWSEKLEHLEIKGGFLEGKALNAEQAIALSKMPDRRELQSIIVAQALSPGAQLAGTIIAPAGIIAGCLKTLVEKLESAKAA